MLAHACNPSTKDKDLRQEEKLRIQLFQSTSSIGSWVQFPVSSKVEFLKKVLLYYRLHVPLSSSFNGHQPLTKFLVLLLKTYN